MVDEKVQFAADLPAHARERLAEMREKKLFTSDLSVSEFLLVKQAGFEPARSRDGHVDLPDRPEPPVHPAGAARAPRSST